MWLNSTLKSDEIEEKNEMEHADFSVPMNMYFLVV